MMDDGQARRWLASSFDGVDALTDDLVREGARLAPKSGQTRVRIEKKEAANLGRSLSYAVAPIGRNRLAAPMSSERWAIEDAKACRITFD
jgi:hypothetical protein